MMKHSTVVNMPTKRSCIKQNYPIILQICCIPENHERRNSHRSFLYIYLHILYRCNIIVATCVSPQLDDNANIIARKPRRCFLFRSQRQLNNVTRTHEGANCRVAELGAHKYKSAAARMLLHGHVYMSDRAELRDCVSDSAWIVSLQWQQFGGQ